MTKPALARLRENAAAVSMPGRDARRLPTIASCGFSRIAGSPATNNSGGASSIWASSAGYSGWSHISKCWAGRASQANASTGAVADFRAAAGIGADGWQAQGRQALAGALMAFEALPNASINNAKTLRAYFRQPVQA